MKRRSTMLVTLGMLISISLVLACNLGTSVTSPADPPKAAATATLSPLEARAGVWQGTTGFGSFTFEVSPGGQEVINLKLHYEALGGGLKGDITLQDSILPVNENGVFEINAPDSFVFKAQFGDDGTSASGHWEMIRPIEASENWTIKDHVPDFTRPAPVSTQAVPTLPPDRSSPEDVETQATKLEDIAGVWLEEFQGGTARLEIHPDGVTVFKIVSGANAGYQDRGTYWFEDGELKVRTGGAGAIGTYKIYVTRRDGRAIQIRYEVVEDSNEARRAAMIYAPLTFVERIQEDDGASVQATSTQTYIPAPRPMATLTPKIQDSAAPTIESVKLRYETSAGSLAVLQDITFHDPQGDAYKVHYTIISATAADLQVADGMIDISGEQQKLGTMITGRWNCGESKYDVTLRVTVLDRKGNESNAVEYTISCK